MYSDNLWKLREIYEEERFNEIETGRKEEPATALLGEIISYEVGEWRLDRIKKIIEMEVANFLADDEDWEPPDHRDSVEMKVVKRRLGNNNA
jgi:hypothetical protein